MEIACEEASWEGASGETQIKTNSAVGKGASGRNTIQN
jgi:hypothetical protein